MDRNQASHLHLRRFAGLLNALFGFFSAIYKSGLSEERNAEAPIVECQKCWPILISNQLGLGKVKIFCGLHTRGWAI